MMNELYIKKLSKKYGKKEALKDVDLVFHNGIYGLLGHNGAGKSTLIRILCGILEYDEGEIFFNNQDINKIQKKYRSIIGYMPQQQTIDSQYTVESFLYYMAALKEIKKPKKKINELMQMLNLKDIKKKKLNSLSGGMKQRVLIAQALLNDPKILFLDEPTAGLDPIERRNFRNIISSISNDKIIILATHVMSDIEFIAEKIIMMKDGVVLIQGSQRELLERTKVYVSDMDPDELKDHDDSLQLVNTTFMNGVRQTRFISKKKYENEVGTTMDDVYLDWLG